MIIKKIDIDKNFPLVLNKKIESFAKKETFSPIWQTIDWSIMLQLCRAADKWIFIWIFDDEEVLLNYAIIEKRLVSKWKYWNFIIWWPICEDSLDILTNEIINCWIEEKVVFTQIESLKEYKIALFKNWTYKKFIEKYTAVIDLRLSEDEILANMKQKWRYNIKLARKSEITVSKAKYTEENLWKFYDLLNETKSRDEFNVNSIEYYREFLNYITDNNIGWMYFATLDSEVIAAWIFIFFWNTCIYYYWASTSDNEKRKFMPTYLLQWEVITEAKQKWMRYFDFLWISDPNDKNTKLWWVTDFKMKLTNETKVWPDSNIFIHKKMSFQYLKLRLWAKKILRK